MANEFGPMTAEVRDELGLLVDEYGVDEVTDALKESVRQGKRNLAYMKGVLRGRRDDRDGRTNRRTGTHRRNTGQRQTTGGKFSGISVDLA